MTCHLVVKVYDRYFAHFTISMASFILCANVRAAAAVFTLLHMVALLAGSQVLTKHLQMKWCFETTILHL